jgi:4-amino-4-deoxy-L-arabinose transferase-like glycosyltransferase
MRGGVANERRARLWSGVALGGVLCLAAALRLWRLSENGYGREYFAAGVRSMLDSWHNLFFASFDAAGFVSLDKPPVALWIQALSAKLFGFGELSLLLPQVAEGLATILLLHHLVRPRFGRLAAGLAAVFLALSPINVAIDRSNNTDSCLVLVLLLAAWAAMRAAENASPGRLALSMATLGIAFNVKMLAGVILAPSLALAYLVGAVRITLVRRLWHLAAADIVLVGVALSWAVAYDLTPREQRPYVSGSERNSMLELALLYNGTQRFASPERPANATAGSKLYDDTPVGPLRLATPRLAAQVAWLLPLAVAGVLVGTRRTAGDRSWIALTLFASWALVDATVYSVAGGVFHPYYLATMAPPLAALAGIGVASLIAERRELLAAALLLTAAWQAYIQYDYVAWASPDWRTWLYVAAPCAVVVAILGLTLRRAAIATLPLALAALLATPAAWALSTVLVPTNVASPKADIAALVEPPQPPTVDRSRLLAFLRANHRGERFALAVPNAVQAAPLVVRSGLPVMAMGGYLGTDPILTPEQLARVVERGELRFVMLGGYSLRPVDERQQEFAAWVRRHGKLIDPALWRGTASGTMPPGHYTRPQLYDLRPAIALAVTQ